MKKVLQISWLVVILIAPFVLWLLPANHFDNTGVITCPSIYLFDMECWGCGMTRAIQHFHHFEYEDAIFYNYGVIVLYPFLAIMWFVWLRTALRYFKILS